MHTLSIIIPAYNEEEAIGPIIERCLAAKEETIKSTDLDEVEIIVVNDGSKDRTSEIAAQYEAIHLITYENNRGYGAAIKTGFAVANGEVLGFLDADGTCDPLFFKELCRTLKEEDADIVIGSRLNAQSQMPLVRWFGNVLYALLLGILSNRMVTDTASGMRVIRHSALPNLYPLPDGMHFPPAMSARAALDDELTIVEVPMPYRERVGSSKLKVFSDGIRFLKTILTVALTFRPARLFGLLAAPMMFIALLYSIYPLEFYTKYGMVEEWMIYRFLTLTMFGLVTLMLLSASVICEKVLMIIYLKRRNTSFLFSLIYTLFNRNTLQSIGAMLIITAAALNYKTVVQYFTTGEIHEHWSKVLVGGFLFSAAAHLFVTSMILQAIDFMAEKRRWEMTYASAGDPLAMKVGGDFVGTTDRGNRDETVYHSS
jgi:glycosyltransferase involved in cell wall biosynthesis